MELLSNARKIERVCFYYNLWYLHNFGNWTFVILQMACGHRASLTDSSPLETKSIWNLLVVAFFLNFCRNSQERSFKINFSNWGAFCWLPSHWRNNCLMLECVTEQVAGYFINRMDRTTHQTKTTFKPLRCVNSFGCSIVVFERSDRYANEQGVTFYASHWICITFSIRSEVVN